MDKDKYRRRTLTQVRIFVGRATHKRLSVLARRSGEELWKVATKVLREHLNREDKERKANRRKAKKE